MKIVSNINIGDKFKALESFPHSGITEGKTYEVDSVHLYSGKQRYISFTNDSGGLSDLYEESFGMFEFSR